MNVSGTACSVPFELTNSVLGATNPNKYFRINFTTGALEIVNSACSSTILSLDDSGNLAKIISVTAPGATALGLTGGAGTSVAAGGAVNITGGAGLLTTNGGSVIITSGAGGASGAAGDIGLFGGVGTGATLGHVR